jgi:hypothetical protein
MYYADIHWKKLRKTIENSEELISELRYDCVDLTNIKQRASDKYEM